MKHYMITLSVILCYAMQVNAQEESNAMNGAPDILAPATSIIAEHVSGARSDTVKKPSEMPPLDYITVDVMPAVKSRKDPYYPEVAQKAGIEGMVYVKIWVGTDGTPKQVEVAKSDAEVLNDAALDAARHFVFTPAYKDNKPVNVWVTLPFKFKLAPGQKQIEKNARELPSKVKKPTVLVVRGPKALESLITYPDEAIRKGSEGAVAVTVRLNKERHATEVKITSGMGGGCDDEVLRAVSTYKFYEDRDLQVSEEKGTVSIVVQFILPAQK